MHYEALDICAHHAAHLLDIKQIFNPEYAAAIVTISQNALQIAIQVYNAIENN